MTCGEKIKFRRKQLNMTQKELASKVGLKFGTISKYEKDEIEIPSKNLKLLAEILDISVDYLIGNIKDIKTFLEAELAKCDLTAENYNLIFNSLIKDRTIELKYLTDNVREIREAYSIIFQMYLEFKSKQMIEQHVEQSLELLMKENDLIDEDFLNIISSLDKNKIVHSNEDNVFPTVDIPKGYPIVGKISAGMPVIAIENIDGYSYAPSSKIQSDYDYFFLKVDGDSMNQKFPNGCLLLVQRQPTLENGQIGVFRINGEDATVKRFKQEDDLIILEPMSTNPVHKVQKYDPSKIKIEIIGKVVSYTENVN